MNFLEYKHAKDLLESTGWTPQQALIAVETELARLKDKEGKVKNGKSF